VDWTCARSPPEPDPRTASNPAAQSAVEELGLSMDGQYPKVMTQEMVDRADKIITMGCGVDVCRLPGQVSSVTDGLGAWTIRPDSLWKRFGAYAMKSARALTTC